MMSGCHKDPVRTAEMIDADGWLHTGDVAEVHADGYFRIVGRKKELIVTTVLPGEWTVVGEELTPSLRIRRAAIERRQAEAIRAMYA